MAVHESGSGANKIFHPFGSLQSILLSLANGFRSVSVCVCVWGSVFNCAGTTTTKSLGRSVSRHSMNDEDFKNSLKINLWNNNGFSPTPINKEGAFALFMGCSHMVDPNELVPKGIMARPWGLGSWWGRLERNERTFFVTTPLNGGHGMSLLKTLSPPNAGHFRWPQLSAELLEQDGCLMARIC